MDIEVGIKLHNRFDVEVKDIITGEIVQCAKAENIVLDQMYSTNALLNWQPSHANKIAYGRGTGALAATRTTLFSEIAKVTATEVELVENAPPTASYRKTKIVIAPETSVGEIITEVGLATSANLLTTHAMLEDSEGSTISIGPKTDTQEITIYSTIFVEITLPPGMGLIIGSSGNQLNRMMFGMAFGQGLNASNSKLYISTDKSANNPATLPPTSSLANVTAQFSVVDTPTKTQKTARLRFNATVGNGKIWSMYIRRSDYNYGFVRILLPSNGWNGYNFIGKAIGNGDGSTVTFNLPWSDINTSKAYKIYVDGVEKTEGVDYTISNSESNTSITFTPAPANGLPITGDWWVDYIPKDSDHVLDITFTIQYGSV